MKTGSFMAGVLGVTGMGLVTLWILSRDQQVPRILVNESPSVSKGLYLLLGTASPERGEIVGLHQPQKARPYLKDLAMDPAVLLLKRVAGLPGDTVCRHGRLVITPQGWAHALEADSRGRPLPTWTGCRILRPDEVFLLGDTGASFDSRYFGPVPARDITGVYGPLILW